jgi:shikimate dehydrogenase
MKINNKTFLNMVIGYPLLHTQSPCLHNTIYKQMGINAVFLPMPHDNLQMLVQSLKTFSVNLAAVTSPYKEKILKYLDQRSPEVNSLQAANTIIQRNGRLHGYNTDIEGIAYALNGIEIKNNNVLIIGAGGAARAMAYFLRKQHANIFYLNRSLDKALHLCKEFGGEVIMRPELNLKNMDIVVNTTTVGMYPDTHTSPLPDAGFNKNQLVFDMIYHPVMTTLLKQAKKSKARIVTGLDMFIGQGLKQIELFTGSKLDISIEKISEILIKDQKELFS